MKKTTVVIFADNMSENPMAKINFKPMIEYVLSETKGLSEEKQIVVTENEEIKNYLGDRVCFKKDFSQNEGTVIAIKANLPLITEETVKNALNFHLENKNDATVVTSPESEEISLLIAQSGKIGTITDDFSEVLAENIRSGALIEENKTNLMPVCDRIDIAIADKIIRERVAFSLMLNGVTIINPENTYIEAGVEVGSDTVIYPGTILEGNTKIGENCILYPNCAIKNCIIGDRVEIKSSTLMDSSIGSDTTVGPYAYVRPGSEIGCHTKIGDFVEIKKAKIGDGTKISHLTYVGDAKVGKGVNFGCGTVTVNYDGKNKFLTEIGDNAFIGCNTNLVAPVKVGDNAFIAAGSTITDEIPVDAFAIARSRQTNKEGWVKPKDK
ncbi:MAG: bifunctional UDP-N-acetylglucosamine diphosphorylase/glucosamine-1-phosphate N-acetyltransferase GlmU [Clostridia bacterium]|nr:bifunctional UDP-N-acetylglucosamine diphosphorylase/glucosamine-1-phosphate N-acetyltransferase GlmU [Clostridia bacterium]